MLLNAAILLFALNVNLSGEKRRKTLSMHFNDRQYKNM